MRSSRASCVGHLEDRWRGFLVGSASPRPWLCSGSILLLVFRYGFRGQLGFLALGILISLFPQSPLRDVLTSLEIRLFPCCDCIFFPRICFASPAGRDVPSRYACLRCRLYALLTCYLRRFNLGVGALFILINQLWL